MSQISTYPESLTRARPSTATLLGQVSFLVAVALGFTTLGAYLGQDLSRGAGLACSIGAIAMLFAQSLGGRRFRVGGFAMGWLYAIAFLLGLGLGPVMKYYVSVDPDAVVQAAGATALVLVGMGALGLFLGKDLAGWMRPLSLVVFGLVGVSFVLLLVGSGGNPFISLAIGGISALLLVVDFNYLRKHGTEDDVIWLSTGIFVSILNIFLSALQIFSGR